MLLLILILVLVSYYNTSAMDLTKVRDLSQGCEKGVGKGKSCTCDPEEAQGVYAFETPGWDVRARYTDLFGRDISSPTWNDSELSLAVTARSGAYCTVVSCYLGEITEAPSFASLYRAKYYSEAVPREYAEMCTMDLRTFYQSSSQTIRCTNKTTREEFVVRVVLNGNYPQNWMTSAKNSTHKQEPPVVKMENVMKPGPQDYPQQTLMNKDFWVLLPALLGIALGILYGIVFFILPENYGDMVIEEQMLARGKEEEDAAMER
ncbi:uncharacterized protein LOC142351887 isoform X2 [Convolutriloba macropyga]|uniref:uncharacterized protein LOC142351887 isoform X2 n=1 Tax=Convolutriloba macropyga TaxID=536237 RepID=UPI003F523D2E